MRERHDAGHVADGPDAVSGAAAPVDRYALRARLHADVLEADALDACRAAGGDQHLMTGHLVAAGERDDPTRPVATHTFGTGTEAHVDALLGQDLADQLSDRGILPVEEPVGRLQSVTSTPNRRKSCASSTPTGPPPRTTRLEGSSLTVVASRLVQ